MEDHAIDKKLERRIAIIGAGAAGLTAAETLRQKGYTHVTIFERSDRVGGKCCTREIDGRLYELGAGIVSGNNTTVLELAKRFQVPLERVVFGKSVFVDAQSGAIVAKRTIRQTLILFYQTFFTYKKLLSRYRLLSKPGFAHVHPDVSQPFALFAKKEKIESLARELSLFFTGFGYGYFEEIPTAYVLKYYGWQTILAFAKRQIYFFPRGIQSLWMTIAQTHEVKLEARISHIERDEHIHLFTPEETFEFDELILTSPLDETGEFLDQTQKEKELFSQIENVDYRTVACTVSGLKKMSGYVAGNFSSQRSGFPVFWHSRYEDSEVFTFYAMGGWKISDEEVVENVRVLIEKMGGILESVQRVARWKYFPHVSTIAIANGYFDQLESIQGNRHTYFAGELLNFSTVGLTSQYAEDLICRFF